MQVSVVIPTFNRLPLLKQAIASVTAQSHGDWELLIVDDGSTDGTGDWVRSLDDARIRLIESHHCANPARLRNIGAAAATGDWLAFLDSDDLWVARKTAVQLAALQDSGAEWAYSNVLLIDELGDQLGAANGLFAPLNGRIAEAIIRDQTGACVCSLVVGRQLFTKLGGFDEGYPLGRADVDLALRLGTSADAVAVAEPLVLVREHRGRITNLNAVPHEATAAVFERFSARTTDQALAELARRKLAVHLAEAGAQRLRSGDFRVGTQLLGRALRNGAGRRRCGRLVLRALRQLARLPRPRPAIES